MKQSAKTSRSTANRNEPDVTGLLGNKLDIFYLFIIIIVVVMSFHSYIIIFHKTLCSISYCIHAGIISQRNTSA